MAVLPGFCKQQLWPLFHYMLPLSPMSLGRFNLELWQAYVKANKVRSQTRLRSVAADHQPKNIIVRATSTGVQSQLAGGSDLALVPMVAMVGASVSTQCINEVGRKSRV